VPQVDHRRILPCVPDGVVGGEWPIPRDTPLQARCLSDGFILGEELHGL
jgi:hypothetical protein